MSSNAVFGSRCRRIPEASPCMGDLFAFVRLFHRLGLLIRGLKQSGFGRRVNFASG